MVARKAGKMNVSVGIAVVSIIVILALGFSLGFYTSGLQNKPIISEVPVIQAANNDQATKAPEGTTFATIPVPAVDDQANGVVTKLEVQVSPGSGRVLTNIDKLFFWIDTQNSIKKATKVAQDVTHLDLSKYDIVYTVKANASVIEGGSAGAALTIGTIAALQNRTINTKVMITGTIDENGKIGPIGEPVAKAIGAKGAGATLFLVPVGQGTSKIYRPERSCHEEAGLQVCDTKTVSEKIDISRDVGIDVKEVGTIQEAIGYFFQ